MKLLGSYGLCAALVVAMFLASPGPVQADIKPKEGFGISFDTPDGREFLWMLIEGRPDYSLPLEGTKETCGDGNAEYPQFRAILNRHGKTLRIWWYIQYRCDEYVKVCARNQTSKEVCATFVSYSND